MKTIKDLKKDDILYGLYCPNNFKTTLEIYRIAEDTPEKLIQLYYYVIIGEIADGYVPYINFPKEVDLDKAVLCQYNYATFWIYTTDFESIRKFLDIKGEDVIKRFPYILDMWEQKVCKNSKYEQI